MCKEDNDIILESCEDETNKQLNDKILVTL